MNAAFILPTAAVASSSFLPSRPPLFSAPSTSAPAAAPVMLLGKSGGRGRRVRGPGGTGGGGRGGGTGRGDGGGDGRGAGAGGGRAGTGGGSGFLSGDSNPFKAARELYLAQIRKNAVATKVVTSFVGFSLATALVHEGEPDWNEVLRNGLLGAVVHGLGGHYYYGASERALPGQAPGNVIGKTVIDFFLAVPLVSVSFGIVKTALDGKGLGGVVDHVTSSWKIPAPIWAMWSCLNMYVAPVDERVLFYNGVIVLSALAKKLSADKQPAAPVKSK